MNAKSPIDALRRLLDLLRAEAVGAPRPKELSLNVSSNPLML